MEIEKFELILEKAELERKVHEKVLKNHKDKKKEWEYYWMPEFIAGDQNELEINKESIAYDEAWVVEAKKMITAKRYKNIPADCLGHYDFDFNEDSFAQNCGCDDYCDCGTDFAEPPF